MKSGEQERANGRALRVSRARRSLRRARRDARSPATVSVRTGRRDADNIGAALVSARARAGRAFIIEFFFLFSYFIFIFCSSQTVESRTV